MPWTFSPSAWLCGLYRLSVLCIVAVVFLPFRQTEVIWFDFLPLNHLFVEFPSHKGAVNFFFFLKFTVPFQTGNFWNVRISDCRITICPALPARDVKRGLRLSVGSCLKWAGAFARLMPSLQWEAATPCFWPNSFTPLPALVHLGLPAVTRVWDPRS